MDNKRDSQQTDYCTLSNDARAGGGSPDADRYSPSADVGAPEERRQEDSPPVPDPKLEEYRKEKEELFDRLLRKQAEFDNYRRRQEREKKELAQSARLEVLRELLPVADACERALSALNSAALPDAHSFRSGVELIHRQVLESLGRFEVQPVPPATGQPFDPMLHHAILREETDLYPENQVIEELQRGYTCEKRLLRPAQVKVAIAGSQPEIH